MIQSISNKKYPSKPQHMGIILEYRGILNTPSDRVALIAELEDICTAHHWPYDLVPQISDDFSNTNPFIVTASADMGLKGIIFRPSPDGEVVAFLFDEQGILQSVYAYFMRGREKYFWHSISTQEMGQVVHIQLVKLLRYLKKKYFKKLEIRDSGGYYPRNNSTELSRRWDFMDQTLATINDIMEHTNFDGKTPNEVAETLQDALSRSLKDISVQLNVVQVRLPVDEDPTLDSSDLA